MKDLWKNVSIPLVLVIIFVIAAVGVVNVSKGWGKGPKLELSTPTEVSTTADKVVISGKTDPKATVKVDSNAVKVDKDGGFSYTVSVNDGVNKFKVTAQKGLTIAATAKNVTVTKTAAVASTPATTETPAATPSTTNGTPLSVTTGTSDSSLAASGPVDSLLGSLGLTALLASLVVYYRSNRVKDSKYTYRLFT